MNQDAMLGCWQVVDRMLEKQVAAPDAMKQLVEHCAKVQPAGGWEQIRLMDFKRDLAALGTWLAQVFNEEPPGRSIKAYWFGIRTNDQKEYTLTFAGSDKHPEDDDTWTVDPVYVPKKGTAPSKTLAELPAWIRGLDGEARELADYILPIAWSCLAIRNLCGMISPDRWVDKGETRPVVVGYEGGDFRHLGEMSRQGLH